MRLKCACGEFRFLNYTHDAYMCKACNVWLEKGCSDPECFMCSGRPSTPREFFELHGTWDDDSEPKEYTFYLEDDGGEWDDFTRSWNYYKKEQKEEQRLDNIRQNLLVAWELKRNLEKVMRY